MTPRQFGTIAARVLAIYVAYLGLTKAVAVVLFAVASRNLDGGYSASVAWGSIVIGVMTLALAGAVWVWADQFGPATDPETDSSVNPVGDWQTAAFRVLGATGVLWSLGPISQWAAVTLQAVTRGSASENTGGPSYLWSAFATIVASALLMVFARRIPRPRSK